MAGVSTVAQDLCSLTLAAGAGSRMPGDMPPKSCCRVGPLSVIENALQAYEQAGEHRRCENILGGVASVQLLEDRIVARSEEACVGAGINHSVMADGPRHSDRSGERAWRTVIRDDRAGVTCF